MKVLNALIRKEFFQIIRDPSSILIAFILPFVLILIFATAISLDNNNIRVGLLIDGYKDEMNDLIAGFEHTRYLNVTRYTNRQEMEKALMSDRIKAMIIFPNNFSKMLQGTQDAAPIQLITDVTDPNIATFVAGYVQSLVLNWMKIYGNEKGLDVSNLIEIENVVWFNPELKSRNFILPGSIAIIMTLVGMILTALVIAREWERGTMEALLTTQMTKLDLLMAKYVAYYGLAMCSTIFCTFLAIVVFGVPFRGSYVAYFITTSLFISTSLGQGFIVSTFSKNQFLSSITAAAFGFLPAVMLSGFLFEIPSMPGIIQFMTYIVPARYYVPGINNLYMAGNVWSVIIPQSLFLLINGVLLFMILYHMTKRRLDA